MDAITESVQPTESPPDATNLAARRIAERRVALGFTQRDLARESGISVATLSAIERGARPKISLGTCKRLDVALGWQAGSTLRLVNEPSLTSDTLAESIWQVLQLAGFTPDPEYIGIMRKLRSLTPDQMRQVDKAIDSIAS
jgi:transcriptional regulator with XRE-family HTH domain